MYDYIDNNLSLKRNWIRQKLMHARRVSEIKSRNSDRLDNEKPPYHDNAPCKHVKKQLSCRKGGVLQVPDGLILRPEVLSKHTNKSLLNIPARRKSVSQIHKQNYSMCRNLVQIKSNYSVDRWEKDYQISRRFKKLRSKPHIFEKRSLTSQSARKPSKESVKWIEHYAAEFK